MFPMTRKLREQVRPKKRGEKKKLEMRKEHDRQSSLGISKEWKKR